MKIAVIGTGYVGLVTGACLSEVGMHVTCVDTNIAKIDKLHNNILSIYEPGLDEIVKRNTAAGRLRFTTNLAEGILGAEAVFIAVGTPAGRDGSADLQYVLAVAREIGESMQNDLVVVTKSTVPVGTAEKVRGVLAHALVKRASELAFDVASNPEFLKEGAAIDDFMKPDRIVCGVESDRAREVLSRLYRPFTLNGYPILFMDIPSAEMTKYAANAMLATRISFMNDIANLCEFMGADVNMVRNGIGSDSRIGQKFLSPGIGYGGSCLPKDAKALLQTGRDHGYELRVLQAVEDVNHDQKRILIRTLETLFDCELSGKHFALWGLSFKPETDDMREAPSVAIIEELLRSGATVTAYDPVASKQAQYVLGDRIAYASDAYTALAAADALLLLTEWREFRMPDWPRVKSVMKQPVVLDGRNIYSSSELRAMGFTYAGIGSR